MIAEMLQLWRAKHGHTTRSLAKVIGISHSTLHRVERGQHMDAYTMLKLINWLFYASRKQ
jgi:transcriptional regulator with XRE-family HTH domain